jgi:O-antigen/teichoic acid export membrane protein
METNNHFRRRYKKSYTIKHKPMDSYRDVLVYLREKFSLPGIQKHSKNVGWMFVAKAGSLLITFIATAYIARNLGPQNYGELSYAISFVGLFSFIASLGIDQILHRDIIKYPEKKNELLGSAIVTRILASLVTVFITVISAVLLSPKDVSLLLIFIISLGAVCGSFQLLSYELQAESRSKYPSLLSLLIVFILNILKITVILFDKGVIFLALIILLEPVLYSLGYIYLKTKIYQDLKALSFRLTTARDILRDSFPLIFASAFYLVYNRIDQVMIKNMINSEAVGLYDAAVRISELSYFIPQIFLVALFPVIINARKTSPELYYKRTKKLLLFILGISICIALLTTLLSKYIILVIFGAGFLGGLHALYICAWSTVGASLNSFIQQILVAENMTKNITLATFFGMITNVALNIILIPMYGISGAAFATLVSYTVPFLSLFLFKKTRTLLLNILNGLQ